MKKTLIITIFATLSCSVFSQKVEVRDTLHGNSINFNATHLTVTGEIDAKTFFLIRDMSNLTHLDLSQAQIVAYKGSLEHYRYSTDSNSSFLESKDNELPQDAFSYMENLKKVILPESLVSFGGMAFNDTNIDSIIIPSGVKHIADKTFWGCKNLVYILLPDSLLSIGMYAFFDCVSLASIKIPEKITTIKQGTFIKCNGLQEILNLDNIESIGGYAFEDCKSLTSFIVPNKVSTIGTDVFKNCESLQSIIISDNVRIIYARAFQGCSSLVEFHIPEHLTEITFYDDIDIATKAVFGKCSKLTSFSVAEKNPAFSAKNGIVYNKKQTELIYCPEGIKGELTIPSSVRKIARGAFRNSNITSIIIGRNVREIGREAFGNCISLATVKLSKKLKIIEPYTFSNTGLTSIALPKNIKIIGEQAFNGCEKLTNIVIPSKVSVIEREAFANCQALNAITIPENVKEIKYRIFYGCVNLKKISVYWKKLDAIKIDGIQPNDDCILEVPFGTKSKYLNYHNLETFKIAERKQ
jgi:hypothetical protein